MHTISIKCSFKTWLLATKSKESMLQWAASLKVAAPSDASAKPAIDAVLAQGWCDLPRDTPEGEVWARHWFVLKSSALQIYPEEQKKASAAAAPAARSRGARPPTDSFAPFPPSLDRRPPRVRSASRPRRCSPLR